MYKETYVDCYEKLFVSVLNNDIFKNFYTSKYSQNSWDDYLKHSIMFLYSCKFGPYKYSTVLCETPYIINLINYNHKRILGNV